VLGAITCIDIQNDVKMEIIILYSINLAVPGSEVPDCAAQWEGIAFHIQNIQ
jgi:hypothetical protein